MAKKVKSNLRGPRIPIFPKLVFSFLAVSIIPLVILGYLANKNMAETGHESVTIAKEAGELNLLSAKKIGRQAIEDSVRALDDKSTEAIEVRTLDLARRVAEFLYERDRDILMLSVIRPDPEVYLAAYSCSKKEVVIPDPGSPDQTAYESRPGVSWLNPENKHSWRHRPPDKFKVVPQPLYREITFIDLKGRETIKIRDDRISSDLRDVSLPGNTFCRAEDYFSYLGDLEKGQIYVSRVIGPYVPGWLTRTGDGAMAVKPESAYAGRENPSGRRFEGLIRWAVPVFQEDEKIGYLTMALDHRHLMEFTDNIVPTERRYTAISDAGEGNYAFMWDDMDQCISHPRDFFICGYDPETGRETPGWISESTYREYLASGLDLLEFIRTLPSFRDFSQKKAGSVQQLKDGRISLDGRILDTAPQCQGWHRGTEDGGSGSFLILWSGLWKLTTYAAIPYYTGRYGSHPRGFGYVTIGANVDDFHMAANLTKANIEKNIRQQGKNIEAATQKAKDLIEASSANNQAVLSIITIVAGLAVLSVSIFISLTITRPLKRLTAGAVAMGRGELKQHIQVRSNDEIGQLARSFNDMALAVSEVDRMKSEFVTIASHELRTPIHAMLLGVSGVLGGYSGEISEEARDDLDIVNHGINRLRSLVDNLLDLSRIEARKFQLNFKTTEIEGLIDVALDSVGQLAAEHSHKIIKKTPGDIGSAVVDEERIIQVLINILSNAVKYSPDQGVIMVKAERNHRELTISVADNGYGIPDWAREKVFDKFYQADSIMSQKVGGSGLGLTISKGIIEEHGGSIRFKSPIAPGQYPDIPLGGDRRGSVFILVLPLDLKEKYRG